MNALPFISENSDNSFFMHDCWEAKSFGLTLINNIPKCSGPIKLSSKKSESLEINTLSSFCANLNTCPFEIVLGESLTSCPCS